MSRRKIWGQRKVVFKMEMITACSYADGNDPAFRRKYRCCRRRESCYSGALRKAEHLQCTGGGGGLGRDSSSVVPRRKQIWTEKQASHSGDAQRT